MAEKKAEKTEKETLFPILVDNYQEKITTFNGGEIYALFAVDEEIKTEWKKRLVCAICFCQNFLKSEGIDLENIPYRIYLVPTFSEAKALLYEVSGGSFHLQPNAASAVVKGALFAQQKTSAIMDVHEYVHIVMQYLRRVKKEKPFFSPMWYEEGLPQYIQGKKDNVDFFELARKLEYLPPFVLKEMNTPTEKFWLEFGLMDQHVLTGNHPGLTACASFVQFLVEKEKIGLAKVWDLMFEESLENFYRKIEELCGQKLFNILNNYLYYVDKPFLSPEQKSWEMPVASARDFRGKFVFENKTFSILNLF